MARHDGLAFARWRLLAVVFATAALVSLSASGNLSEAQDKGLKIAGRMRTEQRAALVIGNGKYKVSPLRNPVNDAKAMAKTLGGLGFAVTAKYNLGQKEMKRAIKVFGKKLKKGGVGLFYYSGHGMQVKGANYLIPVDAEVESEADVDIEAVPVGAVLAKMEGARNRLNVVILDACRNNPFATSFRSASKGLSFMNAPTGTLIAYATAPGSVAADGDGRHGVYTSQLVRHMTEPGLTIERVFKRVRTAVKHDTGGSQVPWESTALEGEFYFKLSPAAAASAAGPVLPAVTTLPVAKPSPASVSQRLACLKSCRKAVSKAVASVTTKERCASAKRNLSQGLASRECECPLDVGAPMLREGKMKVEAKCKEIAGPSNVMAGDWKVIVTDAEESKRKEGVQYFKEGRYAAAMSSFLQVYQTNPRYCRNLYCIAQTHAKLGQSKEAYLFYFKTLDAWFELGPDCGWTLKEKQFKRISTMLGGLAEDLTAIGLTRRVIGRDVVRDSDCSAIGLEHFDGEAAQFPSLIDLPAVWWFSDGETRLEVICDGQRKEVVLYVGKPVEP